jgi:Ni,Fe-hydrogenase III large subunit
MDVKKESPAFDSLSKEIYSATFFEREIKEMFGIEPKDHPDMRRLNLHDEVWPEGAYPLRKDFNAGAKSESAGAYEFKRIEGEGVFEVPVGPVHAGIIGPGHFRFSVAGEPIINLETRLGFTHRGVEKLMEGKDVPGAIRIAECVTGDSCFGHSLAFSHAVEKICGAKVPEGVLAARAIFLELERMYNHVADIGGIAIDVGFSFPSNHAAMIKETMLALNQKLTGSRYLKNINEIGGIKKNLSAEERSYLRKTLVQVLKDFKDLKTTLLDSVSFMDRADSTGVLRKKTAEDLGVVGLAARASGIPMDLRKDFPGIYDKIKFNLMKQDNGDALARLNVRLSEFEGSAGIIMQLLDKLDLQAVEPSGAKMSIKAGSALGYAEGWRGAILYWVKLNEEGIVERCKIVDPSFHNWAGLSFAVLGNIIPDFPLCNKSFNLSYPGNDL